MNRPSENAGRRSSADIEADISQIRTRMDRTLDEIEYRMSPGQMVNGAMDVVRDLLRADAHGSGAGRLGRAIREHPIPVVLIGIGVVWLALAASRRGHLAAAPAGVVPGHDAGALPERAATALAELAVLVREGLESLRETERRFSADAWENTLRELAEQFDRTAAALETELRMIGRTVPGERLSPAWDPLRQALAERRREDVPDGLERGTAAVLADLRAILHADLPSELRVMLGAHFHHIEIQHNRLAMLKEVVG